MKTYLSIDLDYWYNQWFVCYPNKPLPKSMLNLLSLIKHVSDKIIVDDHHQLLHHIASCAPQRIINVDYHQDIAYQTPGYAGDTVDFNCGTFFYFVPNKKGIEYHWICPTVQCWKRGYGLCQNDNTNPLAQKNWIFKKQRVTSRMPYKLLNESNIASVGVAISKNYCHVDKEEIIKTVEYLVSIGFQNRSNALNLMNIR